MKRTLIISNACLSDSISNGRTLAGLFAKGEKEKIAQFFVYGEPDSDVCDNYYQVSDRDALRSMIPFKQCGRIIKYEGQRQIQAGKASQYNVKKTPLKVLLRELVWLLGGWENRQLWEWIENFKPEIICLFIANNTFLLRLAIHIAKRCQIPIVVYTTEIYCFMNYNYITNRPSVLYNIYFKWLSSTYKKIVPYVKEGFFNTTLLRDKYKSEYNFPCRCVMNSSKVDYINNAALHSNKEIKVSYLGNLGLGRHKALIEIAHALKEINSDYYLDVYGTLLSQTVEEAVKGCDAIRYCGVVPYDEVTRIIHQSTLLVHAEWNDAAMNKDLQYAFSTKIADSVSSGTPLLIYAHESLAVTIFLSENDCAFTAYNSEMLKEVLMQALSDEVRRQEIIANAKRVKEEYFSGNDEFIRAFM